MQRSLGTRIRSATSEWWKWLPLLPFLLITLAVMILPVVFMLEGSFTTHEGLFTLENYAQMKAPLYTQSFKNSILLSGITALLGTLFGTMLGYFIHRLRSSRIRELVITLCDVTSNFSGAPLAFAFIVVLGSNGVLTLALSQYFGWKIYPTFSIYSFWGLVLAYTYFQLPLMVLLVLPAVAGLKQEWREAALSLGADARKYWRYVGLPILAPAILANLLLLFANAFGAYATAYTLTGSRFNLVTLQLGSLLTGEVLRDPGAGDAMGILTLLLMGLTIFLYQLTARRARRWRQ
ncbi:MAG: ABC transporter permease subunit [Anaerolineales bacterium]|nr:MAG: ABC transporter permease subunit [Anaerolineales bacterium]